MRLPALHPSSTDRPGPWHPPVVATNVDEGAVDMLRVDDVSVTEP